MAEYMTDDYKNPPIEIQKVDDTWYGAEIRRHMDEFDWEQYHMTFASRIKLRQSAYTRNSVKNTVRRALKKFDNLRKLESLSLTDKETESLKAAQPKTPPKPPVSRPGFIITFTGGKSWLTKDLCVTNDFSKRGIWDTENSAKIASNQFNINAINRSDILRQMSIPNLLQNADLVSQLRAMKNDLKAVHGDKWPEASASVRRLLVDGAEQAGQPILEFALPYAKSIADDGGFPFLILAVAVEIYDETPLDESGGGS